jgi:3-oxo-5alpha-steroid 4-dehydrogenase
MPLGTAGDDGSGICLAQGIGAGVRLMDRCGASRFIAPPAAFVKGVLVDDDGARICDESMYAATLSAHIAEHSGRGWLVVDDAVREEARAQIRAATRIRTRPLSELLSGRANHVLFPRLFGSINLYLNRKLAPTLSELAVRCGIPAESLRATIEAYNDNVRNGGPDPLGKPEEHLQALTRPPFAAIPCHLDGLMFPAPCITLGGLDVHPETQRVRRTDGSEIEGLHAVGRCAAGVASRSYVSGLSLADCVFSGRNVGTALVPETAIERQA